jgi:hypothetical protein
MNIPRQVPVQEIKRDKQDQAQPLISAPGTILEVAPLQYSPSSTSQSTDNPSDEKSHEGGPVPEPLGTDQNISPPTTVALDKQNDHSLEVSNSFGQMTRPKGMTAYARPGQNTLSLLMTAALKLQLNDAAAKYWKIFTEELKVRPDSENFHAYLRVLRMCRGSTKTVAVLKSMPVEKLEPKTFRIAMSTCERDKNNRHCFSNASNILDLMQTALTKPYVPAISSYLEVAITSSCFNGKGSAQSEKESSKLEQGKQIIRALERLKPFVANIRSHPLFKDETPAGKRRKDLADTEFIADCLHLFRRLISAYDLLLENHFVPASEESLRKGLKKEKSALSAFVNSQKRRISPPEKTVQTHNTGKIVLLNSS